MNDSTTLAQVAQQALELGQSAVMEIVTAVKGIAPEIWEMMMRQVCLETAVDCGVAFVCLSISLPLFAWARRKAINCDWDDDGPVFAVTVSGMLLAASSIGTIITSRTVVLVFNNPEYYAIKNLLAVAAGGGL